MGRILFLGTEGGLPSRGIDTEKLSERYVWLINQVLRVKPEDMTVTASCRCRGIFYSARMISGSYEAVAEQLFGHCLVVTDFFLE